MPFPIDTSGQTFDAASRPRQLFDFQKPEDRDAGRPRKAKTDTDTGQPIWAVDVYLPGARRVVQVRTVGEPTGVTDGAKVTLTGLTLNHWQMNRGGKTSEGVTYRAERIAPAATLAAAKAS